MLSSDRSWRALVSVLLRLLILPSVLFAFLIVSAIIVTTLNRFGLMDGKLFAIALIGCLGGLGGSVAAAQEGKLHFPYFDREQKTISLGSLQECMFGAVGAFAIFLFTPGISEQALNLGKDAFDSSSGENRAQTAGKSTEEGNQSVDWIELIAIALVGGYAGRAVITRTMLLYVTKEDVDNAKQEAKNESAAMVEKVQSELDLVVAQGQLDHRALKLFNDQADIHTPPPPAQELIRGMRCASPIIHEQIYVEARRAFHSVVNMAGLSQDKEKGKELKRLIAERMIPVMQCLCDIDSVQQYRGCRYGLALALQLTGRYPEALTKVEEAILISTRLGRPVPPEYQQLLAELKDELKRIETVPRTLITTDNPN